MGTVYLCEHAVLHRRFAVKVLRSDLTSDAELVDRFRNEAIAASRIGQENVVDVVDFGAEEDGALYYVMEALDGRSLGSVIRDEGPLSVARALDLLEQICRALAAAHASGVVHRDVKPDNVFLIRRDGGEQVKVIDFGISQVPPAAGAARITRAGSIIGTPEYMAPEQATGHVIDRRADVYAAGVLAFEMLTGQLPIEADTPIATLVAHQTKEPDPPSRRAPGIPPEVDALVLRTLAKRPEDRFESMEALAAEVARIRASLASAPSAASTLAARLEAAARPSLPRGETVALPDSRGEVRRRSAVVRWAMVLAVGAAAATVAILAWGMREERAVAPAAPNASAIAAPKPVPMPATNASRARTATATQTSTSTSTTTPSSTSAAAPGTREEPVSPQPSSAPGLATEWEKPRPAPPLPELVLEPPRTRREPPRPQRVESAPRPRRERRASDAELHDPYGGRELKDPFE